MAVVEKAVDGREIECAVLGNHHPRSATPGEILPGNDFYDYEAKYGDAGSQVLVPAPLTDDLAEEARLLAVRAFAVLDDDSGDVTVKVGPGDTLARHRVDGPPEVAELLGLFLDLVVRPPG